jgi:hypothetical protein
MKLIYCLDCRHIFNIDKVHRKCRCHRSWGHYLDNINAVYGGKAIPLGIDNESFAEALEFQQDVMSARFTAFLIPKKCKTFIKKDS